MRPARARPVVALLGAAAALLAGGTVAGNAAAADEQLPCTGFEHLARFLAQTYDERPVSVGLQSNGQLLQSFASAGNGSWTAVTTSPGGTACVVATGRDWEQAAGAASAADRGGTGEAYRPAAARP